MTKQAFLDRMEKEDIRLREYIVVVDRVTDRPFVIGCYYEDDVWKIYKTRERSGHYIIDEVKDENVAFDELYELVKFEEKKIRIMYDSIAEQRKYMKEEDVTKIIQRGKLQGYNFNEARHNREDEVVIKKRDNGWSIYVTDERASKVTGSEVICINEEDAWTNFINKLRILNRIKKQV